MIDAPADKKPSSVGSHEDDVVPCIPPSEKESGVKFMTAMIWVGRAGSWENIGLDLEEREVMGER
jgi:hypothetical protein